MGLFDFFSKDPTAGWPEHERMRVVLDVERGSVNGIQLGSPASELARWGRPSVRLRRVDGEYVYGPSGVLAEVSKGTVDYMALLLGGEDERNLLVWYGSHPVEPCDGEAVGSGGRAALSGSTRREDLLPVLGLPSSEDTDAEETVLTFRRGRLVHEVECNFEGIVKRINLYEE